MLALQRSGSLTVSKPVAEIAKAIVHVNRFVGFPLAGEEIVDWAQDIERLAPDRTPQEIAFLMDAFKVGDLEWNKEEGIRNIFKGLRRVIWEDGKLKLLKRTW